MFKRLILVVLGLTACTVEAEQSEHSETREMTPTEYETASDGETHETNGFLIMRPTSSVSIAIPPNAVSVMTVARGGVIPLSAADCRAEQYDQMGRPMRSVGVNEFALWTPVAPGATTLLLSNIVTYETLWSIAFMVKE